MSRKGEDDGLSSLTTKMLCEKHNNDLSPLDSAASDAFTFFRELARLSKVRSGLKLRRWTVYVIELMGRS